MALPTLTTTAATAVMGSHMSDTGDTVVGASRTGLPGRVGHRRLTDHASDWVTAVGKTCPVTYPPRPPMYLYHPPAKPQLSSYAVASIIVFGFGMLVGLLGPCPTVITGLVGFLCAVVGAKEARDGFRRGYGLAVAGIVLNVVSPLVVLVGIMAVGALNG